MLWSTFCVSPFCSNIFQLEVAEATPSLAHPHWPWVSLDWQHCYRSVAWQWLLQVGAMKNDKHGWINSRISPVEIDGSEVQIAHPYFAKICLYIDLYLCTWRAHRHGRCKHGRTRSLFSARKCRGYGLTSFLALRWTVRPCIYYDLWTEG